MSSSSFGEEQKKVYESVIDEQAEEIRHLKALSESQTERIGKYKKWASVAAMKGQATKALKKAKGKTHTFVKILRTSNQQARRKGLFSSAEKQLLFDLQPFIDFKGIVANEDKTPMTIADISNLCAWGKTHTINTVNSLVGKGIIEKIEQGTKVHIRVSGNYFKCG